jgi:ketosteroid isomerase-like protein
MDPDESRYILGGSDIVRGAEAIGAVFAGMGPDSVLAWEPIYAEAAASGDLGYTIGTWRLHPDGDDPAVAATGKYVTIWRKTPDGEWRGAVDIGVTDPPPAPSE